MSAALNLAKDTLPDVPLHFSRVRARELGRERGLWLGQLLCQTGEPAVCRYALHICVRAPLEVDGKVAWYNLLIALILCSSSWAMCIAWIRLLFCCGRYKTPAVVEAVTGLTQLEK